MMGRKLKPLQEITQEDANYITHVVFRERMKPWNMDLGDVSLSIDKNAIRLMSKNIDRTGIDVFFNKFNVWEISGQSTNPISGVELIEIADYLRLQGYEIKLSEKGNEVYRKITGLFHSRR
ncbi:MAG: hypothetical protein K0Q79_2765 [Flavipsychrobacter sp.]|jgi:hypothetical protein|nr:hypothetical protein [Flavipsychrobacter sp.]